MVRSIDDARRQARSGTGGRVPPHNLAAEESLLGAMLLSRDAVSAASLVCAAEDFYKPAHSHVFDAILSLHSQGEPADPVTVADELRRSGVLDAIGGPATLVSLQAGTPATSNAASYAKIVEEHALLRRLIGVAGEIAELGYSVPEDVEAAIDRAEAMVFDVADRKVTDTTKVLSELLYRSLERIEALVERGEDITGVPTGYLDIDEKLCGLQPSTLVIVGARPAMGKALALDTCLPTPTGWTTMADVAVGDQVLDEKGAPCRVEYASPAFVGHRCYRVGFDDGTSVVADAGHRWLAYDARAWKSHRARTDRAAGGPPAHPRLARDQSARWRLARVVTTEEMVAEGVRVGRTRPNWYLPLAGAIDLPEADLPVDAYVLGCWLGDGAASGSHVGAAGADAAHFAAELAARGYGPRRRVVAEELAAAGLLGARKHIPAAYLRGSAKQRLDLLQGLMDADGAVTNGNGTAELCLVDRALLAQVWELVCSLGHKPSAIRHRLARLPDGRSFDAWRFRWSPRDPVFRLARKAERLAATVTTRRNGRASRRAVVAIDEVPSVPTRCIAVSSPSHLFLAGPAMVPTHNTSFALGMACHAAVHKRSPVLFFSLEMGHLEITQRLLCSEAMVDSSRLRNGRLLESDWPRITAATSRLGDAPLYVDDNPNVTVMEVRAKARRLKSRLGGLGLIVIDYLQLMTGRHNAENRQVEIAEMSRGLKILARELEVPVVALSQLSRNLEGRGDKRPMLSDLRESGCLTGDTRVLRADTGAEVTLSELLVAGERDVPVWSVDDERRLVARRMSRVFPSGIKTVFSLTLASGRTVRASANHPFLTPDGWRRLDELQPGGRLAVAREVPAPLAADAWPAESVVLLAHLLGDESGSLRPVVRCRTSDRAVLDAVRRAAVALGSSTTVHRQGNWWSVQLGVDHPAAPDPVARWLEGLGLLGLRHREAFVPPGVAQLPNPQLAVFLRHLWASGGSLRWHDGEAGITFVTASRRLAEGVQLLLARFGVEARLLQAAASHAGVSGWTVAVETAAGQRRFLDEVGAFGLHVHHVPLLLAKLPRAARQAAPVGASPRPDPLAAHTIGFVRHHGAPPADAAGAAGDLAWDRVVSIERDGEEPVYDATVEGTHNFVANGITVHNSLEQDADVVMFIYRDEVYNPESTEKGAAEIIIAKHRNGPTGSTKLVFQDRYTRFDNAARV
jgi:replicative DNA helicase